MGSHFGYLDAKFAKIRAVHQAGDSFVGILASPVEADTANMLSGEGVFSEASSHVAGALEGESTVFIEDWKGFVANSGARLNDLRVETVSNRNTVHMAFIGWAKKMTIGDLADIDVILAENKTIYSVADFNRKLEKRELVPGWCSI